MNLLVSCNNQNEILYWIGYLVKIRNLLDINLNCQFTKVYIFACYLFRWILLIYLKFNFITLVQYTYKAILKFRAKIATVCG